ncbi:MAG: RNA methyltransferase [Deltaproteobacteria bacterium]|nr:RNA methyltransferase [Deltaproteobacteria bacterium]MBW2614574.1 RNA methyltransferase [Deltaproteobacteria bacterium]
MRLYIGLVHYPVYNKNNEKIASAITTLDLHDIARLARTYDVKKFFVITPLDDQQELAERVIKHWTRGYGSKYNRHRKEAIKLVAVVPSLERAVDAVAETEGEAPLLIATDASRQENRSISFEGARAIIKQEQSVILLFGTAWGLDKTFMTMTDHVLEPISGRSEYNHLSVRTAAAIILDRLVGRY